MKYSSADISSHKNPITKYRFILHQRVKKLRRTSIKHVPVLIFSVMHCPPAGTGTRGQIIEINGRR